MNNLLTLFDLLGVLSRRRYQVAERYFSTLGLNHTEARLLTLLDREGGDATQEALSNLLFVDRSNAGRALKSLEHAGYIERYQHDADKRTNVVHITPKGHETATAIAKLKIEIATSLFGTLTDQEAGTINDLLGKASTHEDHA